MRIPSKVFPRKREVVVVANFSAGIDSTAFLETTELAFYMFIVFRRIRNPAGWSRHMLEDLTF